LSAADPVHEWSFAGRAGDVVSLNAVDLARAAPQAIGLDMRVALLDEAGGLMAENDDQAGFDLPGIYDAHVEDVTLPRDGQYTVQVTWVQGAGTYTLALTTDRELTFDAGGVATVSGALEDAIPVQRWAFAGAAGERITVTMTGDGVLDPALELLLPDGATLRYIDDALDVRLGVTAQLALIELPAAGRYVIEASRTALLDAVRANGTGAYTLVVVRH
jgi:hypothetical protein